MLDDDFNKQMAALDQSQRGANDRYARDMGSMSDDLDAMGARFEREMRGRPTEESAGSSGGDGVEVGTTAATSSNQRAGSGMRRQMDRGEAVKETKRGRADVKSGTQAV